MSTVWLSLLGENCFKQHQIRCNEDGLTVAAVCRFNPAISLHLFQYFHYFIALHEWSTDSFKDNAYSGLTKSRIEHGVGRIRPNQTVCILWHKNRLLFITTGLRRFSLFCSLRNQKGDPGGRTVKRVGRWPLACLDCGFESLRRHDCMSIVNVVCCQVAVSRQADPSSRGVLPGVCVYHCVRSRSTIASTPTMRTKERVH